MPIQIKGRQLAPLSAAAIAFGVFAAGAFASAPASAAVVPACTGDSVIVSMPLIDKNTGYSSWNYGYVQLWYNYCTGDNWGRVVSGLGTSDNMEIQVYNNVPKWSGWDGCGDFTECTSSQIYSPNNPAGAFGAIDINGVIYYAEADQSGANCQADATDGRNCVPVVL